MREFIELAATLNFSRTAENLFLSQSALSRHIANVEADLDQTLIERTTHGVELTPAGEVALENFRTMMHVYDQLIDQLGELRAGVRGVLSVAFPYYASGLYLQPLLAEMDRRYPEIRIETQPTKSNLIDELILGKHADLGICIRNSATQDLPTEMGYVQIASESLMVALSKDHPLRENESLSIADLSGQTVVLASSYGGYNRHIEHRLAQAGVTPKKFLYADSEEMVTALILNRQALALRLPFAGEGPFNNMQYIPLSDLNINVEVDYIYLKENENPALTLFLESARSRYAGEKLR